MLAPTPRASRVLRPTPRRRNESQVGVALGAGVGEASLVARETSIDSGAHLPGDGIVAGARDSPHAGAAAMLMPTRHRFGRTSEWKSKRNSVRPAQHDAPLGVAAEDEALRAFRRRRSFTLERKRLTGSDDGHASFAHLRTHVDERVHVRDAVSTELPQHRAQPPEVDRARRGDVHDETPGARARSPARPRSPRAPRRPARARPREANPRPAVGSSARPRARSRPTRAGATRARPRSTDKPTGAPGRAPRRGRRRDAARPSNPSPARSSRSSP